MLSKKTTKPIRSSNLIPAVLLATTAILPAAMPAWANDASSTHSAFSETAQANSPRSFNIPAQPLADALKLFGRQSGWQFSYPADLTRGLRSNAVAGDLAPEAALRALLSGTGINWQSTGPGTVALSKPQSDSNAMVLGPITIEGQGESAYGPVAGYKASRSATATKTDTPISETPASIQVIPRQVIEDQGAQNLKDVYENVSGVVQGGNTMNAQSEVLPFVRGFESSVLRRNGMRATTVGTVDLANVERVEVLKGPASILYGAIEPGGMINVVTKRPQADARYEMETQAGSYDHYRATADLTGPMTADGALLYRTNVAYTNAGSFRDGQHLDRRSLAPSFLWTPRENTEVLVDFQYTREKQPYDSGVPIGFNGEQLVSDSKTFTLSSLDGRDLRDYSASIQLNREFSDAITFRHQLLIHRAHAENESIRPRSVTGTVGAEVIRLRYQNEDRMDDEIQSVADLQGKFSTGNVDHTLLFGSEFSWELSDFLRFRTNLSNLTISEDAQVNFTVPSSQPKQSIRAHNRRLSFYTQDQMSLLEDGRLKLLIGGRFDFVKSESETDGVKARAVHASATTARAGVLYELTDAYSVYASASQSFEPQGNTILDVNDNPLAPETGEQLEIGIKAETPDKRFSATASIFHLEKENVAVVDSVHQANTGDVRYFGGVSQRSKGFELDLSGEILPGLNLLGAYSYSQSRTLENPEDATQIGQRLGNVPVHKARVWASYDFPQGTALEGLSLGGGVRYVSDNRAQFDTAVVLDSYWVADLGAKYRWGAMTFNLNVYNLFDEHFYERASNQAIVHPGAPLTVLGRISMDF
ncbi:MAG: TonB-dependent receptor [Rhodospirillales bacterium]